MKIVNKRARHDYFLLEEFEAGIVLAGPEVKSLKAGHASLGESFVRIIDGQAWLLNAHINPYPYADNRDYNPRRSRKLLLHRQELLKIQQKVKEKGLTIVPVSCYTKGRNIKLKIVLARGKKKYDKRETIKRRDIERQVERELVGSKFSGT